jgi:hypothetical protein
MLKMLTPYWICWTLRICLNTMTAKCERDMYEKYQITILEIRGGAFADARAKILPAVDGGYLCHRVFFDGS